MKSKISLQYLWSTMTSHDDPYGFEHDAGPYFRLNLRELCWILTRSFCENQLILS